MLHKFFKHKLILLLILVGVTCMTWLVVRALPASEKDIRRSTCLVEGSVRICLVSNRDTVELVSDSVHQQGVWINRHWWWPSCDGRVLTINHGFGHIKYRNLDNADTLRKLVAEGTDSLGRLLQRKEVERKELQYYLRSHGVIDEGYTQIATYANAQNEETKALTREYGKLQKIKSKANLRMICKGIYKVSWYDNKDSLNIVRCEPIVTSLNDNGKPIILHTLRKTKPWGVYAVRNVPWGVAHHKKIIAVTLSSGDDVTPYHALLVTGKYDEGEGHNLPRLFATDGSPVFTQHGRFIGVIYKKEVVE